MSWNDTMGLMSTVALSLPVFFIIAFRLAGYRTFPALLAYYIFAVAYNFLTEGYVHVNKNIVLHAGLINNLLDAPLILLFLTYFSRSVENTRRMHWLIGGLIVFDIILVSIWGLNFTTVTIAMAPGLLAILGFSVIFFVHQVKITVTQQKATGRALISASLLFVYGCFSIIYLIHYVLRSEDVENTFLVYFIATILSSILMSVGIYLESKRVKKLSELKVVRRELSEIYGEEKTATPLRPAVLDFDSEQWN